MNFFTHLFGLTAKPKPCQPTKEELAAIRAHYDALLRPASIAQLGETPAHTDPLGSWFGGHGMMLPSEGIPVSGDKPMFPLLQVNCAELPYRPPALVNTALLVFWINPVNYAVVDCPNGEGWLLREYASLEGLVPVTDVPKPKGLKTLPITWTRTDTEAPSWDDVEALLPPNTIPADLQDAPMIEQLIEQYELQNDTATKFGGYPALIQGSLTHGDTFVFQIGSEDAAQWNWGDGGILYLSKTEAGEWVIEEQMY
jgi:hypothetical protein